MVKPKLARIAFAVAVGAMTLLIGCLPEISLPGEDEVLTPEPDTTQDQDVVTPGVTQDQVLFGQSVDFGEIGTSLQIGIEAAFNEINSRGGVNGRKLSLITLDDDYDPAKALRNVDRFIEEDQVFAILGSARHSNSPRRFTDSGRAGNPGYRRIHGRGIPKGWRAGQRGKPSCLL